MERLSPEHKEIISKKLVYHEDFIKWIESPDEYEFENDLKKSMVESYVDPKPRQVVNSVVVTKGS